MAETADIDKSRWQDEIESLLAVVCRELDMDHAFIGRVVDGRRDIRYACGPNVASGDSDPLEQSYCRHIVEGTLGPAIPDTSRVPVLRDLQITQRLSIASYLGIPLTLQDGSLYGTLCAYSGEANRNLGDADARLLRLIGRLVAARLEAEVLEEREDERRQSDVRAALSSGEPTMVFQPIVDLASRQPIGFEALARFSSEPYRTPDVWIADAIRVGLGVEVELRAIENALEASHALPAGLYLSLNASPSVVTTGRIPSLLAAAMRPIVVEVTEHERATGAELLGALAEIRAAGHKVSLDDGGAGYAGLSQVLELKPEVMKMDRNLVTGIDTDPVRQAMVGAGSVFAAAMGGELIAEGIETEAELEVLLRLGVTRGQGYLFGRPAPAQTWADVTQSA